MDQVLSGTDKKIAGWFDESPTNRWKPIGAQAIDMSKITTNQIGVVAGYSEPKPEPKPEDSHVTYKFVSGTSNKTLPEQVTALLPKDTTAYTTSMYVTPVDPTSKVVNVEGGSWKFVGYDNSGGLQKFYLGMTFTGTWVFTPTPAPKPQLLPHSGNTTDDGSATSVQQVPSTGDNPYGSMLFVSMIGLCIVGVSSYLFHKQND